MWGALFVKKHLYVSIMRNFFCSSDFPLICLIPISIAANIWLLFVNLIPDYNRARLIGFEWIGSVLKRQGESKVFIVKI